jgi:hypothetical protein
VLFENPGPNPKVTVTGEVTFNIAIGGGPAVLELLEDAATLVRNDVIPSAAADSASGRRYFTRSPSGGGRRGYEVRDIRVKLGLVLLPGDRGE